MRETRADFSALHGSAMLHLHQAKAPVENAGDEKQALEPLVSALVPRSQHGWKKGWQNNEKNIRHELYKGDNIKFRYLHIYIYNLFLNPFVTLLGLPLHAAVESIAKHAIPSVGSGDQRLQNFTNLECHV